MFIRITVILYKQTRYLRVIELETTLEEQNI